MGNRNWASKKKSLSVQTKKRETKMEITLIDENIVNVAERVPLDCLSIKTLDLSKNRISYLPDELGNLLNLRTLNLSRNRLDEKSFPQTLSRLQMLEEVNLSSNSLSEIPSFLLDLPRLKVLHLAENKLAELPEGIGRLRTLERPYLGKNCLTRIPRQVIYQSNSKSSQ